MTADSKKRERAEAAKEKPPEYGPNIDLEEYQYPDSIIEELESFDTIPGSDRKLAAEVGFDSEQKSVAGSFIQFDNELLFADLMIKQEGLEVLPISAALKKHDWLSEYLWNAVPVDTDKFTAKSELEAYDGYFVRAKAGVKVEMPVQSCLILKTAKSAQNVHNIIIAEEGSEMHLITGCATPSFAERSLHLGISEFYIMRNARLTFTMIHKWNEQTAVRPRSSALVEAGGVFISSYAVLSPLKSIQTFPKIRLLGLGAKADVNSVVYGSKNSEYDIGGQLSLEAPKSNGKVISRTIATDQSNIIARGDLIGLHPETRGRLECDGLLLSNSASIRAVPMLNAKAEGTELSHEATVGKVGEEQLSYLMSRGLDDEEATALIVSGFVQLKVPDLPPALQSSIDKAIKLSLAGGM